MGEVERIKEFFQSGRFRGCRFDVDVQYTKCNVPVVRDITDVEEVRFLVETFRRLVGEGIPMPTPAIYMAQRMKERLFPGADEVIIDGQRLRIIGDPTLIVSEHANGCWGSDIWIGQYEEDFDGSFCGDFCTGTVFGSCDFVSD